MVTKNSLIQNLLKWAVHFSTSNSQCDNFLASSLNEISFHEVDRMVMDNR